LLIYPDAKFSTRNESLCCKGDIEGQVVTRWVVESNRQAKKVGQRLAARILPHTWPMVEKVGPSLKVKYCGASRVCGLRTSDAMMMWSRLCSSPAKAGNRASIKDGGW